jgi:hypothetical protein
LLRMQERFVVRGKSDTRGRMPAPKRRRNCVLPSSLRSAGRFSGSMGIRAYP